MKTKTITITISAQNGIDIIKLIENILIEKVCDKTIIQFGIDDSSEDEYTNDC